MNILQAIDDPALFRPWFKDAATWQAWRAFLCALFALPMSPDQLATFAAATERTDAPTAPATEAWLICRRRAGKSFMLSVVAVFLSCFHSYREFLQPGERATVMVIAADRKQARTIIRYVGGMLNQIPMLRPMVLREAADGFDLNNGVTIEIGTASFRSARGYTLAAALLDELAFFRTDDSADPDYEILAAIRPGLATIPTAMLLCASSPYAKKGALHDAFKRHYGVAGAPLVWRAPTRTMNPSVRQSVIDEAMERDPAAAASEYLAEFRNDLASFVDRMVVEACVDRGVSERPFKSGLRYSAFVDPSGGSSDSMTLAIGHREGELTILDAVRERMAPFDPESCVAEFVGVLKSYGIREVTGDRYAAEWVRQSFERHAIRYKLSEMNRSELYLETLPQLNAKRVRLLDSQRLIAQFAGLERRTTRGGKDSVDHSPGSKDDVANCVAGLIACGAVPSNECSSMSLDEFFARGNPENWAPTHSGGKVFAPMKIAPHPTKGLPGWMS